MSTGERRGVSPPVGPGSLELDDPRVVRAVEAYLAAIEAGQKPNRPAFLARHADIADALAGCLDTLEFVHAVAPRLEESSGDRAPGPPGSPAASDLATPLGDFRIVREIGRGGMGVVYEAEQLSLGRRIALKVLPFALTLDPRQLQRFKNEAQAAAHLHHTNIVPVYAVGCERGVHFYAMQFIDGRTLAEVIRELRRQAGLDADPTGEPGASPGQGGAADQPTGPYNPQLAPAASTARPAALTQRSVPVSGFFRTVAQWGVQAAEALEHAHQMGVVHRDVKPGNLLVDAHGHLWVTDFGLAQVRGSTALTMTGDLVGTLRYMSPEQALARRGLVDHRSDIYSLGATLYELLTLEPAFDGRDREEVLRQIAFEDPRPPRRLNRTIPADLETVVLKALAKGIDERYATAQELADDLRRFLEHRPVRARRPTPLERAAKWARRHRPLVASAVLLLVLAVVGLTVSTILVAREKARTQAAYDRLAVEEARTREAYRAELEQRKRADEGFDQARDAIDFFTQAVEEELRDRPGLQELRRKLLEAALAHYQNFIAKHRDDPAVADVLAQSQLRVARLLHEIGAKADAQEALEQARLLQEELFRNNRPHGFGRGRPGGFGPPGFPGDSGVRFLLVKKSVQEELKLSEGQVDEIAKLSARSRDLFWLSPELSPEERRAGLEELEAREKALVEAMRPEQARRLKQIVLQQRGPHALADANVADALRLTAVQREQIRAIQEEARRSLWASTPRGGSRPDSHKRPGLPQAVHAQLLNVLTEKQKARWKEMTGEPFKGELWPRFGGPFGPGRDLPRSSRP